jgi:hypothetical protein
MFAIKTGPPEWARYFTQHKMIICDIQHNSFMLSVIMLNVVAPQK